MYKVSDYFEEWSKLFNDNEEYLTELDSVAGDGDLGIVMNDGFSSTYDFVLNNDENDVGKLIYKAAKHFNNVASSSMGTLLSAGFMKAGKELRGKDHLDDEDIKILVSMIGEGVKDIGKAKEGEKTFLDAIMPAKRALEDSTDLKSGIKNALEAAKKGVADAKSMVAKHGRIAFKGEESKGIIDPGTVVAVIIVEGIKNVVEKK